MIWLVTLTHAVSGDELGSITLIQDGVIYSTVELCRIVGCSHKRFTIGLRRIVSCGKTLVDSKYYTSRTSHPIY